MTDNPMPEVIEAEARMALHRALNEARSVLNHTARLGEAIWSDNFEDFSAGRARTLAADAVALCAEISALEALRKIQRA